MRHSGHACPTGGTHTIARQHQGMNGSEQKFDEVPNWHGFQNSRLPDAVCGLRSADPRRIAPILNETVPSAPAKEPHRAGPRALELLPSKEVGEGCSPSPALFARSVLSFAATTTLLGTVEYAHPRRAGPRVLARPERSETLAGSQTARILLKPLVNDLTRVVLILRDTQCLRSLHSRRSEASTRGAMYAGCFHASRGR